MEEEGRTTVFFLNPNNTPRSEELQINFQIYEVLISPFVGVVLLPKDGGICRAARIGVETSGSTILSEI